MLIVQMTEKKAREHLVKRLARIFRVSPEVVKINDKQCRMTAS